MKKYVLLLLFLLSGCTLDRAGGAFFDDFFTDIQYQRYGFVIAGPEKEFIFNSKSNREILKIRDTRLNYMTFIDQGCDQKVDEVVLNKKTRYLRGDDSTKSLFQQADATFQRYRGYLNIKQAKETWKGLTPQDISGNNGLGNI